MQQMKYNNEVTAHGIYSSIHMPHHSQATDFIDQWNNLLRFSCNSIWGSTLWDDEVVSLDAGKAYNKLQKQAATLLYIDPMGTPSSAAVAYS